jgi:hypothetical protein
MCHLPHAVVPKLFLRPGSSQHAVVLLAFAAEEAKRWKEPAASTVLLLSGGVSNMPVRALTTTEQALARKVNRGVMLIVGLILLHCPRMHQ